MAIDLNAAQVKALQTARFGPQAIRAFQLGTADPMLKQRMNQVLAGVSGGLSNAPTSPQNTPIFGRTAPLPGGGVVAGNTQTGRPSTNLPAKPNVTPGGVGASVGTGVGTFGIPKGPPSTGVGNTGSNGLYPGTPFIYDSPSNPYNLPNAPGLPDFNIPSLEMRDFTEQAKKIAAEAFAPYLAAFDIARSNAQAQGKTSKEATAGLYANFVKDIASKAAETADRYDEVKGETAARGEAQQADIAESQGSANANIAGQLKALGLDVSAPSVLEQGAEQQTTEQAEAGAATESQQQFLDTQKLAQGDYDTQYGSIMGHQGLVAQQDIDSQLMNLLAGIDVNKANASGEQSTTALSLAQQLADRDYQMQAQNANLSMQGQQMEYSAGQDQFQNQIGLFNTWEAQDQQDYANAFDLWKTQQGFDIDWAGLGAQAGAGAGGTDDFDMSDYPGQTQTYGWLKSQLQGDEQATDKVYQAIDGMLAAYTEDVSQIEANETVQVRAAKFARQVGQQLSMATGIPASLAQAAAANYYQEKKA